MIVLMLLLLLLYYPFPPQMICIYPPDPQPQIAAAMIFIGPTINTIICNPLKYSYPPPMIVIMLLLLLLYYPIPPQMLYMYTYTLLNLK